MALTIGELVWKITGDNSEIKKSLKTTEKGVKGLSKGADRLGKIFKKVVAVAVVAAIFKVGKALITAASNAEETGNKFAVVFDEVIDDANEMANVLSKKYGLANTVSKELLSATGDLLVGFSVAKGEALDLSFRVQSLAADLASFSNFAGGAEGASKSLTAALLGEVESAKSLGLALGETQLRAFAEEQGKVFKNLTLQEKMFLRLELAVSQSGSAIGDFQRSIDSFANQTRILDANTQNLSETYGDILLPVATFAIKALNEQAEATQNVAESIRAYIKSAEGSEKIGDIIGGVIASFKSLEAVVVPISDSLKGVGDTIIDAYDDVADILGIVAESFNDVKNAIVEIGEDLGVLDKGVENSISLMAILGGSAAVLTGVFEVLSTILSGLVTTFVDFARALVNTGTIVSSFYLAVAGKGTWKEFQKNVSDTGESFANLATGIVDSTKAVAQTAGAAIDNFGEDQNRLASGIATTFEETQNSVSATVQTVLRANNTIAKSNASTSAAQQKSVKAVKDAYSEAIKDQSGFAALFGQGSRESFEFFENLKKNLEDFSLVFNTVVKGASDILGAVDQLQQANTQNRLDDLDRQLQAELEAAGVAEDTAVQAAEREVARADREGSEEEKRLAKQALTKVQIEEKFAKKKAQIEYDGALASWEIQRVLAAIQLVAAPLNAYVQTLAAPWPLGMILAPINAAIAATTAGLQYAAVVQSKPAAPAFQTGGIVPGSSFSGDNVNIKANSKEAVLTQGQQKRFMDIANGSGGGGQEVFRVVASKETTFNELFQASQNGSLFIDQRAVVSR